MGLDGDLGGHRCLQCVVAKSAKSLLETGQAFRHELNEHLGWEQDPCSPGAWLGPAQDALAPHSSTGCRGERMANAGVLLPCKVLESAAAPLSTGCIIFCYLFFSLFTKHCLV